MADECPKCPPVGAPLWLATFADLMSLLMCFFVLLLSMATMDAAKFKKMADSMVNAFGVQREVPAYDIPMGTSVIAQHFSPAPTEPTPLEEVKQTTAQEQPDLETAKKQLAELTQAEIEEQSEKIKEDLKEEIKMGLVSVETEDLKTIIRISEKGSFPSGSAVLNTGFEPVLKKITAAANESPGKVLVSGHSDNIPIRTQIFRSNWELSASRAVTVFHFMLDQPGTQPSRFVIQGYADTRPLAPNDTAENRALNRRVEIVLVQTEPGADEAGQEFVE